MDEVRLIRREIRLYLQQVYDNQYLFMSNSSTKIKVIEINNDNNVVCFIWIIRSEHFRNTFYIKIIDENNNDLKPPIKFNRIDGTCNFEKFI